MWESYYFVLYENKKLCKLFVFELGIFVNYM